MLGWLDTYGRTTAWIFPKPSSIISWYVFVMQMIAAPHVAQVTTMHMSSLADAIAEGVEHWPQVIGQTVHVLQRYYRDKVGLSYVLSLTPLQAKLLAPEFDDYVCVMKVIVARANRFLSRECFVQRRLIGRILGPPVWPLPAHSKSYLHCFLQPRLCHSLDS